MMAADDSESDKEIAAESLPEEVVEAAVPIALTNLQPWHTARKQFIRVNQWLHLAERLLDRIDGTPSLAAGIDGTKVVRYLTLPGADFFDVQLLAEHCAKKGYKLTATGFLAGGENNAYRARGEMRQQELIDRNLITIQSHTFARRIEEIWSAKGESTTYTELRNRGPFHIVNVDACGSISATENPPRLIDAVHRIVQYQLSVSNGRWLLFVTTDARKSNIAPETMTALNKTIIDNAQQEEDFNAHAKELLLQKSQTVADAIASAANAHGRRFIQLVSLGLSKWLLHLAQQKGWRMKAHPSFCYATTPGSNRQPSMPCLAFEFVPPDAHLPDQYGIAKGQPPLSAKPAESGSMRALRMVADMVDLDARLAGDTELREQMALEMMELLENAGYAASAIDEVA